MTTVRRALRRAGWTWKKLSLRAAEQTRDDVAQARQAWRTDPDALGGISPERLTFPDECGVPAKPEVCAWTTMSRLRGRSPRGERACASAPFGHWTRVTVLGALGAEGMVGAMSVELAAHKTALVRALLDRSGFARRCLPPCSPDLDPIEPGWAKAKAALRRAAARTANALHEALGPALAAITPQDAAGFFRRCGYG